MSQPKYPGSLTAAQVAARLAEAAISPDHKFWSADIHMLSEGAFDWARVLGHRQVTDVYLLALAVHHGGRFITLKGDATLIRVASPLLYVVLSAFVRLHDN